MVLEDYGRGGLHEWLQIDSQKGIIENKDQSFGGMLSGELIDALIAEDQAKRLAALGE